MSKEKNSSRRELSIANPKAVVPKLECTSEPSGGLVTAAWWLPS